MLRIVPLLGSTEAGEAAGVAHAHHLHVGIGGFTLKFVKPPGRNRESREGEQIHGGHSCGAGNQAQTRLDSRVLAKECWATRPGNSSLAFYKQKMGMIGHSFGWLLEPPHWTECPSEAVMDCVPGSKGLD